MADPGTENGSDASARLASVRGLDSAEDVIMQWDSSSSDPARQCQIWEGLQHESDAYLEAVDEIQTALESLSVGQSNQKDLTRAQNLYQLAMTRLEEELKHLLLTCNDPIDPEWLVDNCSRAGSFNSRRLDDAEGGDDFDADVNDDVDEGVDGEVDAAERTDDEEQHEEDRPFYRPVGNIKPIVDLIPPATVLDLSNIVKRMIIGGYKRECVQVYASIRRDVLEETLKLLGAERLSIDEVGRMKWEDLEFKISKWNQRMKVCVRALFASEKHLCESVFADAPVNIACSCFNDLGRGPMMQLLSFAEAVAISRRAPEKLFKILDMYETLRDLLSEIKDLFCGEVCAPLRADADAILARLGECAKRTFGEFEIAIQRDGSKTPVPGGGVHPLTRYVMNYIKFMCDYSDTMKLLFEEEYDLDEEEGNDSNREGSFRDSSLRDSPRYSSRSNDGERGGNTELSTLGTQTIWVSKVLLSNLEEKSKLYKDLSLTYLFLMNNIHYIVQKVKSTEVRAVVGDDWVRKNTSQVRQYASSYQRAAWGKVLSCLRDEGIHTGGGFSSGVSKPVLKERFKSFNAAFEEVQKAQTSWIIQDDQLRDELRIAISDKILPAYRSFLGRYGHYLETQRHPERYIKYTSEDVEEFLNNLFEIHSPSLSSRDLRRRSSHHGSSHHGSSHHGT